MFDADNPFATGDVYSDLMPDNEGDHVGGAYGVDCKRLVKFKSKRDPGNLFRIPCGRRHALRP